MINESKKSIPKNYKSLVKSNRRQIFVKSVALLMLAMFIIGNLPNIKTSAAGTVTGLVFQDFNGNGVLDTTGGTADAPTAVDVGIGGVTVTAYDNTGAARGTAVSDATTGVYTLNATGTGPYRLEFTTLPAGFQPSARSTNSLLGGGVGTTTQFVANGNTTDVNLAINRPEEYCQNNPNLVTCRFYAGTQNGNTNPVLQRFAYDAGTIYTDATVANYDAPAAAASVPASSIGSVYGLAYRRSTQRIYASAYYRRYVGFGPGANGTFSSPPSTNSDDPSAIYVINPATNTVASTITVPNATNNNHSNAAATDDTNASWDAVGKTSLGGIALSDNGNSLFVMNLQDKTLYELDPATGANLGSQAIPTGITGCPDADVRPFALKFYRGNLYAGMVCSAESTGLAANLRAYIYQVDPATLVFGATPYTFSLNYNRGFNEPAQNNGNTTFPNEWRPWVTTIRSDQTTFVFGQPMLTDIEFDNGNLVLGIRDRLGDQGQDLGGAAGFRPAGEVLRACGSVSNFPTGFTLEANGRCGGIGDAPQNTGQGPGAAPGTLTGSGEYYFQDDYSRPANSVAFHDEVLSGGLLKIPGYGQTLTTAFDPIARTSITGDATFDQGVRWLDNATGESSKAYRLFDGDGLTSTGGEFGKANGLGDIISLCDSAPIEIGNRVWLDSNNNGVQDPQESRANGTFTDLTGITVRLYNAANALVATAVTNQDGEYYFTSGTAADPNTGDNIGIVNGGILPNTAYQIRFDNAADFATGGDLAGLVPTRANATQQDGDDDSSDSDAVRVTNPTGSPTAGTFPVINYTTGAAGSNDHTLDAGFASPVSIGSTVFNDANNNGLQGTGELGISGVTVQLLFDADNSGTINGGEENTVVASVTTDANGNYFFGSLTPGNYQVRIPTAPATAPLSSTTTVTTDAGTSNIDSDDNGSQTGGIGTAVTSPVINLSVDGEVLNAVETGQGGAQDDADDNNGDMTIDFGFFAPVSLGNRVWNDANNNGLFDTGETLLSGVTVNLYVDADNDGVADGGIFRTTTTVGGLYLFDALPANTYIVGVVTPTGLTSSSVNGGDPDAVPSDTDDNGVAVVGTETRSNPVTLTVGGEPTGETPDNDPNTPDTSENLTVDFGFTAAYSLGNRVFFDTNNNGQRNTAESGIAGVSVSVFAAADTAFANALNTVTTDSSGYYRFDNLGSGSYVVRINPVNFQTGGALIGYQNTTGNTTTDTDSTDTLGGEDGINPTGAANTVQTNGIVSSTVALGATNEPLNETDLQTVGQFAGQGAADNQANMTIDFGFYRLSLSGTVWNDTGAGALNNNGTFDTTGNAETGRAGVTVRLYDSVGTEVLVGADGILGTADDNLGGTVVTDATGGYAFSGLAPGDYTVRITPPAGTLSSLNTAAAPDPDDNNNPDNDDNGAPGSGATAGLIVSLPITLTAGGEPTVTQATGSTVNTTLDFGLISGYSIGNRVWFDTNNNGQINAGELGISGVAVSLFSDANGNGSIDGADATVGAIVTTDANGYYRFDNLTAGNYIVRVNPTNFVNGASLAGYQNTGGSVSDDTTDSTATAAGENGVNPTGAANTIQTNGILSNSINVGPSGGTEPINETDVLGGTVAGQGAPDSQANMTVDFGFYRLSLSGTVWNDGVSPGNGTLGAGEPGVGNIRVRLFAGTTEILVGPDGILGTSDDAAGGVFTSSAGEYNFQGLPPGTNYVVAVTQGSAVSSQNIATSADPNNNVNNDDNGSPGTGATFTGLTVSGPVTLAAGSLGTAGNNTVTNATGATSNPTVDFGFVLSPTVVKLDAFDAYSDGESVELKWSTGDEAGNLGFNVYREVNGKRQLLNAAPIAGNALRSNAQLAASGSDYTWTDKEFVAGAVYYLEDLDVNGSAELHGAVAPQSRQTLDRQPNAKTFSDLAKAGDSMSLNGLNEIVTNAKVAVPTVKELNALTIWQQQIAAVGGAKITVNHDGWYRVTARQLAAAGFDLKSNSQLWQLYADGAEVPFKLNSDSIEFFGRGLDTPLTDKRAYYLVNGQTNGLRINAVEGGSAGENADANSFGVTVERKDRAVYVSTILNGDNDNWFGAAITRNSQTVQTLNAVNVANGQAHLSVKLQGVVANDHAVSVRFNDMELGTVEFSGFENKQFEFDLPAAAMREGINRVYLQSIGGGNDASLVDSIRLSYQRGYTTNNNQLRFMVPAAQTARVNGFTDANISVYEIRNGAAAQQVVVKVENSENGNGFSLGAATYDREFIAVADSTVEQSAVTRNIPSTWNNAANGANFVIVTSDELRESAGRLAKMREAQGLKTHVVAVEDIFDEFSFGRRDPNAIKSFLKTATTKWQLRPQYALLFGDSSYDTRNNLNLSVTRDIVPTKSVDTEAMETSSDSWLADFNNDGAEDIALGRLPVGNVAEAAAAIEKLARFDAQGTRQENTNVLVADSGFESYSETLQTLLPNGINAVRIDRAAMTDAETHQKIVERLNANPLLVTYTGHGSQSVWATNNIFRSEDAAQLANNQLSFYLLMNCLNGYNHQPTGESLGEALFRSNNGAVAVWTSSGITQPDKQATISQAFTRFAFSGNGRIVRLGDVVKAAKQASNDSDVRRTWQLIGDPTISVK